MRAAAVFAMSCAIFAFIFFAYHFMLFNDFTDGGSGMMNTGNDNGQQQQQKQIADAMPSKEQQQFRERVMHLDLKGAAPRLEFLCQELFPLFARLGFNALLIEYEDMFPYGGELSRLARKSAYSVEAIQQIVKSAADNGLELIPLVQTFGHMEFALKHAEFATLRENPVWMDSICPSNARSIWLIRQMLAQIRHLHPSAGAIHIGCDEAWHLAEEALCQQRLNGTLHGSKERLKLEHISRVARISRDEFAFQRVYAWNDMFDRMEVPLLKEYELGRLLIPVIWGYERDVTRDGYFPHGLFERLSQVFDQLLFASAFKGANGVTQQFVDIERYMDNLRSYRRLYHDNQRFLKGRLTGIVLTGWQRYAHQKPLCELLPAGIPAMAKQALYIQHKPDWNTKNNNDNGNDDNGDGDDEGDDDDDDDRLLQLLMCPAANGEEHSRQQQQQQQQLVYQGEQYPFQLEWQMRACKFPGADMYAEIEQIHLLQWKFDQIDSRQQRQQQPIARNAIASNDDHHTTIDSKQERAALEAQFQAERRNKKKFFVGERRNKKNFLLTKDEFFLLAKDKIKKKFFC